MARIRRTGSSIRARNVGMRDPMIAEARASGRRARRCTSAFERAGFPEAVASVLSAIRPPRRIAFSSEAICRA